MVDWNKDLSFGRKNEPADEPETVEETQSLPPVEVPEPVTEPVAVEPEPVTEVASEPEPSLFRRRRPRTSPRRAR